jgi:hypothetical protein
MKTPAHILVSQRIRQIEGLYDTRPLLSLGTFFVQYPAEIVLSHGVIPIEFNLRL